MQNLVSTIAVGPGKQPRVVTGLPDIKDGSDLPGDYGHDLSEMPEPRCHFKSDVYQLGKINFYHISAQVLFSLSLAVCPM